MSQNIQVVVTLLPWVANSVVVVSVVVVPNQTITMKLKRPTSEGMKNSNVRLRRQSSRHELNGWRQKTKNGNLSTKKTNVIRRSSSRRMTRKLPRQLKLLPKLPMILTELTRIPIT